MAKYRLPGERTTDVERSARDYLGIRAETVFVTTLDTARGASADTHIVDAQDDDIIKITLEDGIRLWTSVADARTDFGFMAGERGTTLGNMLVPQVLPLGSGTRGGGWVVKALELIRIDLGAELENKTARVIARKLEERIEKQVGIAGLYALAADGSLGSPASALKGSAGPFLIFVHGTGSSTEGSFGKLFLQPEWESIRKHYDNRLMALQHRTLSESPLQNALDLVTALPAGATIDLVGYSRGGLVCELVCRAMRTGADGKALDAYDVNDTQIISLNRKQADNAELRKFAAEELDLLARLGKAIAAKKLNVRHLLRVACPARGTTLASRRLDRYLSLVVNLMELIPGLAGNPVYDLATGFLLAVAKTRTDPTTVPGLEAQMPESPLVAMLNRQDVALSSRLTIVAGDVEGSGILGTLKVLATDLFYRADHDIVVNTDAMYGGARRMPEAMFMFDRGSAVNHFSYFQNRLTAKAMADALTQDKPMGFQPLGDRALPSRAARARSTRAGPAPAVFLLPGTMGSQLRQGTNQIWFDAPEIAFGGINKLKWGAKNISADGAFDKYYGGLADYLSDTHDVITFDYDWRKSVLDEGQRLAMEVQKRLNLSNEPIRFIAHSMGGLVVRAMAVQNPDLWARVMQGSGARFVMLGTPNLGAFSIVATLLARDATIKQLAMLDITNDTKDLLKIITQYPGVLELLPRDAAGAFYTAATWTKLRNADGGKWAQPVASALAAADAAWTTISSFAFGGSGMAYIAGFDPEPTADGLKFIKQDGKKDEVIITGTNRGDGRVPWSTGIPPGVPTWYAPCVHGDLASHEAAFPAYLDILRTGKTSKLKDQPPAAARGVEAVAVEMPEAAPDVYPTADEALATALGSKPKPDGKPAKAQTVVTITHGDLSFVSHAITVGHYRGDMLVGPERVLDQQFDGRLSQMRQLGLYPGEIGTAEWVTQTGGDPPAVLILGLGTYGELSLGHLTEIYSHGLRKFVIESTGKAKVSPDARLTLGTLIIGHRESRLTLRDCIAALLEAVIDANQAFPKAHPIAELRIIEIFEDTAIDALRILRDLCGDLRFNPSISFDGKLKSMPGGRRRIGQLGDASWWRKLMITHTLNNEGRSSLKFTDLSAGARAAETLLEVQGSAIEPYLKAATGTSATDVAVSRTLFEMLTPAEFKPHAAERRDIVLVVDEHSAQYPWELLYDRLDHAGQPLAVRFRCIRQFIDSSTGFSPARSGEMQAVVIGDSQSGFAPLPGAQREAMVVAGLLKDANYQVRHVDRGDVIQITNALFLTGARILHLATHGAIGMGMPPRTGAVIGEDTLFTAQQAKQLRPFPELVFLNCCHLGHISPGADEQRNIWNERHRLAANLAEQFIRSGAKAVVAAGWAVDDAAAAIFARVFYQRMLGGSCFADAVFDARVAIWDAVPQCNTWGAYQCYGDPDYRFERSHQVSGPKERILGSLQETIVELDNFCAANVTASQRSRNDAREKIKKLENLIPEEWKGDTAVQERLGRAFGDVDMFDEAVLHYAGALAGADGGSSLRASEQMANLIANQAVDTWRRSSANAKSANEAVETIRRSIRQLESVNKLMQASSGTKKPAGTTVERLSLLGSAWTRMAIVTGGKQRTAALAKAAMLYEEAYRLSKLRPDKEPDYRSAVRWQLLLALAKKPLDTRLMAEIRKSAEREETRNPNFWSLANVMDSLVVESIAGSNVAARMEEIEASFKRAWRRSGSYREGRSIRDQLLFIHDILVGDKSSFARDFMALIATVDTMLDTTNA